MLQVMLKKELPEPSLSALPAGTDLLALARWVLASVLVGTLLVGINHGAALAASDLSAALLWKIALTYGVSFALTGWVSLRKRRAQRVPGPSA